MGAKNIRYFYLPPKVKSDYLIVTFSGFHGRENEGIGPAYNYVKPISKVDCHRIFILDDYDKAPCYYLGKNMINDYEVSVAALIMQIANQNNIYSDNIITCGSSKGGTAAVYFAFKYNFGYSCVGSFQLKVGTYLNSVSSYTRESVLKLITGDSDKQSVETLDNYFINFFKEQNNIKTKLYIHAGDKDPHYLKHVVPFLDLMNNKNKEYELDLKDYISHGKVGTYYTEYLLETLPMIVGENIIKNLNIESNNRKISVKVESNDYFNTKMDVSYAYYIYNDKYNKRIDYIKYSKDNTLSYDVHESGKYRVKVFVKTGEQKITQYTDYVDVKV